MLKFFISVVVVLLFSSIFCEFYLRSNDPSLAIDARESELLMHVWLRDKVSLAMPPFNIISNRGWQNPERLNKIYTCSHLPPNSDYLAEDFLRQKKIEYKIHINSLGYRGHEVAAQKPKNIYRIAAYGSYMTFGHGINDDQTYTAVAEHQLNSVAGPQKFEILNGGMETGTFILGLSRISHELETLNPDAVVLEYGFLDGFTNYDDKIADNYFKLSGLPEPEKPLAVEVHDFLKYVFYRPLMLSPLSRSFLMAAIVAKLSDDKEVRDLEPMKQALIAISNHLHQLGKKVFLVISPALSRQEPEYISQLKAQTGDVIVDIGKAFNETPPTAQDMKSFDDDPTNYLSEIGIRRDWTMIGKMHESLAPYFQSVYQLSPLGQKLAGMALAKAISQNCQKPHSMQRF